MGDPLYVFLNFFKHGFNCVGLTKVNQVG
jgi:hypothetical protein